MIREHPYSIVCSAPGNVPLATSAQYLATASVIVVVRSAYAFANRGM